MLNFIAFHAAGIKNKLQVVKCMSMNKSVTEILWILLHAFLCPIKNSSALHLLFSNPRWLPIVVPKRFHR